MSRLDQPSYQTVNPFDTFIFFPKTYQYKLPLDCLKLLGEQLRKSGEWDKDFDDCSMDDWSSINGSKKKGASKAKRSTPQPSSTSFPCPHPEMAGEAVKLVCGALLNCMRSIIEVKGWSDEVGKACRL